MTTATHPFLPVQDVPPSQSLPTGNTSFPTINFFSHLFLPIHDHKRLLVQQSKTNALLHGESWHKPPSLQEVSLWAMDTFLIFPSRQNRQQLWVKEKQLAQEGDTFPALQAKRAGTGALLRCFASAQSIGARCRNTYLLGQHRGPSAGCVCLPVPQGGQSPRYGTRLHPERNENPGEAKNSHLETAPM